MLKNVKTFFVMLKQLYSILNKKQRLQSVLLIVAFLLVATLETLGVSVVIPFIIALLSPEELMKYKIVANLMDFLGISSHQKLILVTAILIILCYIIKNVVIVAAYYFQSWFHNNVERDLSVQMLSAYMKHPYSFFLQTSSADMIRGIHEDIVHVAVVIDEFSGLFAEVFTCGMIGILLICMDPLMAIGLVGVTLLIALFIILLFKRKIGECSEECRKAFSGRYKLAMQSIHGFKEIAVYQKRKFFIHQYSEIAQKACKNNVFYLFIQKLPNRIIETVFIACLLILACIKISSGGDITQFTALLGTMAVAAVRILPSISNIANHMNGLVFNRTYLESAYSNIYTIKHADTQEYILETDKDIQNDTLEFHNELRIDHISWKYENGTQNVLDDISFCIQKGESVGLIGESGAGKSTMVNVILGLLKAQTGQVTLDGMNILDIPYQWAELVGYVPQSVFLLDDTVRNNIAFGIDETDINDDKIWEALRDAQIDTFVKNLPDGLDTFVGEEGVRFSGGQRQRIAIARALYHNPEILILDEATSALDNETEAEVMRAIEGLHGKKTMIVIAHRLTTIQKCDKVYKLKNGKISLL